MRKTNSLWLVIPALIMAAGPAMAAEDQLLNLLPSQPLAVLRVTGLGDEWQIIQNSDFAKRFQEAATPDVANGLQNIRNGLAQLQVNAGINAEEVLKDVFGNDCLVAVYGKGDGVFLSTSPTPLRLKDAAEKIINLERAWGKIQAENAQTYKFIEVHQSTFGVQRPDAQPWNRYHCFLDNTLVVSSNEETIKKVIDIFANKERVSQPSELTEAFAAMDKDAVVRGYIDTDLLCQKVDLETALDGKLRHPLVRIIMRELKTVLPLIRYVTVTATPKDGSLEFRQTVISDEKTWPDSMKALLPKDDKAFDVLQLAPESAVLCVGHRVDKAALWRRVLEIVSKGAPERAQRIQTSAQWVAGMIGGMTFDQLLGKLDDQVGVFITSADAPDAVPAISIAVAVKKDGQDIATAFRTLAGTAAGFAQMEAGKNGKPSVAVLAQENYKDVAFTILKLTEEKFGGHINITLFVLGNMMVVSTNTDAARMIVDRHAAGKKDLAKTLGLPTFTGTPDCTGRIDLRRVNEMIFRHKMFLIDDAVRKGKPQEQAQKDIENIAFLLGLAEDVTFYSTHTPNRIDRVWQLRFPKEDEAAAPVAE